MAKRKRRTKSKVKKQVFGINIVYTTYGSPIAPDHFITPDVVFAYDVKNNFVNKDLVLWINTNDIRGGVDTVKNALPEDKRKPKEITYAKRKNLTLRSDQTLSMSNTEAQDSAAQPATTAAKKEKKPEIKANSLQDEPGEDLFYSMASLI